ncbi:MAG TPA: hypothetical protein VFZ53_24135 [Polyangiaceae bacterium]
MSIEQLIVLVIFVLAPLLQTLRAALQKKREASQATPVENEEPPPYWPTAPEPLAPPPPVHTRPVTTPPVRTPPARIPRAVSSASVSPHEVEPPARQRSRPHRPAVLMPTGLIPRDRQSLRRAMALVAILGPPRSLDREN